MENKPPDMIDKVDETSLTEKVDTHRRKLSTAGIAGTGVLLSVASRSAMGSWGTCTGSEIASGNLSRHGEPNPCGCSPGFWWRSDGMANGPGIWFTASNDDPNFPSGFKQTDKFNTAFGVSYLNPDQQLLDVGPGSGEPSIAMHAVAAVLNKFFYADRYPTTIVGDYTAVIAEFRLAFANNALEAFKSKVDVYHTADLWCFGGK